MSKAREDRRTSARGGVVTAGGASGTSGTVTADWYADADQPARTASARRAAEGFEAEFRRPPAGVWAAPGRVNVIGEHVDYNGGLCLPFALAPRTYVALSPRDDDGVTLTSAQVQGGSGQGRPRWRGRLGDIAPGTVDG